MVQLISFGFKHGKPKADVIYDVRVQIRNRYREWKGLTGMAPSVMSTVWREGRDYFNWIGDQVEYRSNKGATDLTVAVGCVGGKHRSVASAMRIQQVLKAKGIPCVVTHRDIDK